MVKRMLIYSWPMVPNAMSMWVMRASDRFVISIFMGVTANAIYAAANKVPSILTLAQNTFALAWQENASVSVNDPNVGEYYSDMFKKIFSIMAGFMSFLIGGAPILFSILIRGDYSEALDQIPVLLMAMLFFGLSSFVGGVYIAFMQTRSVGITTIVAAAINLIVDLSTIRWIGLYAASGSTSSAISSSSCTGHPTSGNSSISPMKYATCALFSRSCFSRSASIISTISGSRSRTRSSALFSSLPSTGILWALS